MKVQKSLDWHHWRVKVERLSEPKWSCGFRAVHFNVEQVYEAQQWVGKTAARTGRRYPHTTNAEAASGLHQRSCLVLTHKKLWGATVKVDPAEISECQESG